jgi:hypothetical protein
MRQQKSVSFALETNLMAAAAEALAAKVRMRKRQRLKERAGKDREDHFPAPFFLFWNIMP